MKTSALPYLREVTSMLPVPSMMKVAHTCNLSDSRGREKEDGG
jgi:hypothetical protein